MANENQEPPRTVAAFTQALEKAGITLATAVEKVGAAEGLSGAVIGVPETGLFGKRNDGCNINRGCTVNESCSG